MKVTMRNVVTLAGIAALLLTGCSSPGTGTAAPSPSMTGTSSAASSTTQAPSPAAAPAQSMGNGSLDDATLDKAFLEGARKAVPAGPADAALVAMGRGICSDLAAGVPSQTALDKVKAQGLTQNDALTLLVLAKAVYCSTPK